ncbi:MAG: GvpL/GvpF family gas vesicle protein [Betaproteobacteria bacterium]|nr:GvpL/GvpF family gas vesicle protein [Betaproteobacteria bacterium]
MVSASDPAIQSRIAALSSSPGAQYLQQKQLDAMIEAALHAWVERVTHDLHEILELYALASTKLRCHASAVTGRPDRMVFNRSFLVTAETVPDFRWAFSDQQPSNCGGRGRRTIFAPRSLKVSHENARQCRRPRFDGQRTGTGHRACADHAFGSWSERTARKSGRAGRLVRKAVPHAPGEHPVFPHFNRSGVAGSVGEPELPREGATE